MGELNNNLFTSNRQDWETPDDLFDKLHEEFHFTLDVCANQFNKKLDTYYSIEDDAFSKEWVGNCWMNPPYGRDISKWIEKAFNSGKASGATVVCLLPVRSDTIWWHKYCMNGEIRFINKRLKFKNSNNMATFPNAIVIFGDCANIGQLITYDYR